MIIQKYFFTYDIQNLLFKKKKIKKNWLVLNKVNIKCIKDKKNFLPKIVMGHIIVMFQGESMIYIDAYVGLKMFRGTLI